MNLDQYKEYTERFNSRDYDGVCDFYTDPMNMDFFGIVLQSRDEMKRFYSFLHTYVKESVQILNFASSDTLTAVDAIVRVEGIRDLDSETLSKQGMSQFFPIKAGEVQEMRQFIFYTIVGGKIAKVECAIAP